MTFAGLEEAEMLFIPDWGSDAVVVEVVRVAYRPSKAKLVPRGAPVSCPLLRVESEKQQYSRYEFVFHGFRVRSGGQSSSWIPHPQVTYSVLRTPHLQ